MNPEDTGARWRTIERVSARDARRSTLWGISLLVTLAATPAIWLLSLVAGPAALIAQCAVWATVGACALLVVWEDINRRRRHGPR